MVDDVLDDARPPSGGAYTAVATHDHHEMVALLEALSWRSGLPVAALLREFGEYLFGRFARAYPAVFGQPTDTLGFLEALDGIIHAEVRRLYPDAELPRFEVESRDDSRLVLVYTSARHWRTWPRDSGANEGPPATQREEQHADEQDGL